MRQVHVQMLGCAESDLHRQLHLLKKSGVKGISPFFSCPSSSLLDGVVLIHGGSSSTLFLGCMSVVSRQTFIDVPRKKSLNSSRHVSTQLSCSSRSIIAGYLGEEPLWLCGYDLRTTVLKLAYFGESHKNVQKTPMFSFMAGIWDWLWLVCWQVFMAN